MPVESGLKLAFFATLEIGLGVVMLAAPDQFGSPVFAGIKDALGLYGIGFVLCGAALLAVALGLVPFVLGTILAAAAAVPLALLALGYVRGGLVYAATGLLIESAALVVVVVARARGTRLPADRTLGAMIGAIEVAFAVNWLARPAAFDPAVLGSFYTRLDVYTATFLVAGLAMIAFAILGRRRSLTVAAALGVADLLAALLTSALERRSWTGIVQYALLAAFLLPVVFPRILRLSVGGKIVGAITVILAALVLLAGTAVAAVNLVNEADAALDISQAQVRDAGELLGAVSEMQSSARGFVITGDERLLAPYDAALESARARLARLRASTAADAGDSASVARLAEGVTALDALLRRQVAARRSSFEEARDLVASGEGRTALETLRGQTSALFGRFRAARDALEERVEARTVRARSDIIAGASLTAALALVLALYLAAGIGVRTARLRAITESTTHTTDLAQPIPVATGGDDIDALARSLEAMRVRLRDAFAAEGARAAELRALFDNTNDAVLLTSTDGRILDANAAALALFGWDLAELREGGRELVVDPSDERLGPALAQREATGHFVGRLRMRRKDGTTFTGSMSSSVFPGAEGEQRTSMIIRDESERERAEAALAAAKEEAERANQAKSAFLANMSHELRTPLNAVLGFSDLLEEQVGDQLADRQRSFLRHIREAGVHLLDLINDILDLAKVEAGKVELRPEILTLGALLEPVVASAQRDAQAKGLRFDVSGGTDGPDLLLDPTRVRQVLLNLLSNAVKFTPWGGTVALRAGLEGGDLVFEIADTGIGIPPEARDRVFGVFERLHEGRANASGTGLGLAITKRLVELHGGAISYVSEEGRGSTFRVRLPNVGALPIPGERLLLVEDDRHDADLIVTLASAHQLPVEVARTLVDARAALRRRSPIGVLVDLRLPDGRGEDLLRDLRAHDGWRDVPAIVVTVESEPAVSVALGADDYLTKPIDRARLERWLARVARARGPAGAEEPHR